jgi:hypothetical protein
MYTEAGRIIKGKLTHFKANLWTSCYQGLSSSREKTQGTRLISMATLGHVKSSGVRQSKMIKRAY